MSNNAITTVAPIDAGALRELEDAADDFAAAAMADNTRRAFLSALRGFAAWCGRAGHTAFPASEKTVRLYLAAHANRLAVTTLSLHLAAIRAAHKAKDIAAPDSAELRRVWRGIRAKRGRPPAKKRGLTVADLRRALKLIPDSLVGSRNRAILLVGYAGALRRNELAALTCDGEGSGPIRAVFVTQGLELQIDRSKGDQLGKGAVLAIPFGKRPETCAVAALRAWLDRAKITSGHVFRGVAGDHCIDDGPMSDRTVARVVKQAAKRAGLDPALFSGHSLRRGMLTDASLAGASPIALQAHARHSRFDVTKGYIDDAERFKTTAARKLGL